MNLVIFFLTMAMYNAGFAQMSKIQSIKTEAQSLSDEITLLSKLFKYSDNGSLVIPFSASIEVDTLKKFNIRHSDCYEKTKTLPALCISTDNLLLIADQVRAKSLQVHAYMKTYKQALSSVQTPSARLMLKQQIDNEKRAYEAIKLKQQQIDRDIHKLQGELSDDIGINASILILIGFGIALLAAGIWGFAAMGGEFLFILAIGGTPLLYGLPSIYSFTKNGVNNAYNRAFEKDRLESIKLMENNKVLIALELQKIKNSLKQNLDYFDMINRAALEEQKPDTLGRSLP